MKRLAIAAAALLASCAQEAPAPAQQAPTAATEPQEPAGYVLEITLALYAPEPTRPGTANFEADHRTVTQAMRSAEECETQRRRWDAGAPDALTQEPNQAGRELLHIAASDLEPGYVWAATGARCRPA